jgi:hypothetical protein
MPVSSRAAAIASPTSKAAGSPASSCTRPNTPAGGRSTSSDSTAHVNRTKVAIEGASRLLLEPL